MHNEQNILNIKTLNIKTLNIKTLNIKTLNIETLNIKTLNIKTLNIKTLNIKTLNIKTLNIKTLNIKILNTINLEKTHYMVFHRARIKTNSSKLSIRDNEISRVFSTKFLGIIIDDQLKWLEHIQYIKNNVSKSVEILCKVQKYWTSKHCTEVLFCNNQNLCWLLGCISLTDCLFFLSNTRSSLCTRFTGCFWWCWN